MQGKYQNEISRKRLMFAESIRDRSRQNILKQKRKQFQKDLRCEQLIENLPSSIHQIYRHYSEFRDLEQHYADCFHRWGQNHKITLEDPIDFIYWGSLLAISVQKCDRMEAQFFLFHFNTLMDYSPQTGVQDLRIFHILLTVALKSHPEWVSDLNQTCQKCLSEAEDINKQQIEFLLASASHQMQSVWKWMQERDFQRKLINNLDQCLNNLVKLGSLIKLLVVITFYDQGKITKGLIELNLLRSLSLLFEFVRIQDGSILNICILLTNITQNVQNPCCFESSLLSHLNYIRNDDSFSTSARKEAAKTFLVIINCIVCLQRKYFAKITEDIEVCSIVVDILQQWRSQNQIDQLFKEGAKLIEILIATGEEFKDEETMVNPYIRSFKFTEITSLFEEYPEHFEEISKLFD